MSRLRDTLLSVTSEEDDGDLDLVQVNSSAEATVEGGVGGARKSKALEAATLFALTINYIFGAGVLSLPHQVAHGGIVASSLLLVFSSCICLLGMVWVLECQERARVLKGLDLDLTSAPVEYGEMCRIFLGYRIQRLYDVSISIFVICSAWMYAAIFSVTMSKTIPLFSNSSQCDLSSYEGFLFTVPHKACWGDYMIYLALFAIMLSFLVRTNIGNMATLQLVLTGIGMTAIVTMIITVIAAMPEDGLAPLDDSTKYFNASSFGAVFGTFVFAQLSHHGVPLLSSVTSRKELVRPVFVGVIATTTTLYLVLGIMCALFFGTVDENDRHEINNLITLNWQDYTAGKLSAGSFATFISYFVRLYPAVTVSAAAPLYAITLGNSWHATYYGDQAGTLRALEMKTSFYLAAMVPSIVCAALMANIAFMLFFVGISAFVIAFFLPPLMQLTSRRMVPGWETTYYSTSFSEPFYCYLCLCFAVVALLYTVYSQFTSN